MIIRQAQPIDEGKWNTYVQNHPEASAYHLWAWKSAISEAYKRKGYYLIAEEDKHICGILPLIHLKAWPLQNQLVALPYCDVGGPLTDNQETCSLLLDNALLLKKKLGADKLQIRTRSSLHPSHQMTCFVTNQQTSKVSLILDLPSSSEDLWNGFKSKLRSQILKAEKNGLSFKLGQEQDIHDFYAIFSKNMHELGSPVHSKKLIQSTLANYGENAKMGLVYFENQPVGCGIILFCGKIVAIPWASTLRNYNKLGPNMLLYWNLLKYSADNGFATFDFGRSTPDEGTFKFKIQWGAEPRALRWYTTQKKDQFTGKNPSTSSAGLKRKQLAALWNRLPLWVANYLGPILRRYISL